MRKIELHWETRNEYVLTANELKSLEEKHRRELERRKKEEEERKKKIGAQVSDLQKHGGISQSFVNSSYKSNQNTSLSKRENSLKTTGLVPKSNSLHKPVNNQNNGLNNNNKL